MALAPAQLQPASQQHLPNRMPQCYQAAASGCPVHSADFIGAHWSACHARSIFMQILWAEVQAEAHLHFREQRPHCLQHSQQLIAAPAPDLQHRALFCHCDPQCPTVCMSRRGPMQAPSCMQNRRPAHQGESLQAFMHACIQCSVQSCTISMPAHEASSAHKNVI